VFQFAAGTTDLSVLQSLRILFGLLRGDGVSIGVKRPKCEADASVPVPSLSVSPVITRLLRMCSCCAQGHVFTMCTGSCVQGEHRVMCSGCAQGHVCMVSTGSCVRGDLTSGGFTSVLGDNKH
jgi:hypothetical protein